MIKNHIFLLILSAFCKTTIAQGIYSSQTISSEMRNNANAVVRLSEIDVAVKTIAHMRVRRHRVVTILNRKGEKHVGAYLYYDKSKVIKKLSAIVYNSLGEQIEKFKKSDFKDDSAVSGGTMYSDYRVKYLSYIPQKYPYTVEIISEYETKTTAFIPEWFPLRGYQVSVEKSICKFMSPEIPFKYKEYNVKDWISTSVTKNNESIFCSIENQPAISYEHLAPNFRSLMPHVKIVLGNFNLYGKKGSFKSWENFGKWQYENLLQGRNILDETTLKKIKTLTQEATTPLEKAKIIYQYVQDNTRYISVQLGIGGWQPEAAENVDRLKYGDCKGLTNYTLALLHSQGIESYYAEVYSGENKKSFDKEFISFEGDHIILCLPQKNENIWLECTSQTAPFGFISDFTDDRDVLVMKETGGEIMHTTAYAKQENIQYTDAHFKIDNNGAMTAVLNIESKGLQYANLDGLEKYNRDKQKKYYLNKWSHINGLSIDIKKIINDKQNVLFTENMIVNIEKAIVKVNEKRLVPLNLLNKRTNFPVKYASRKLPFQISRSFMDTDRCVFEIPSDFKFDFLPENILISTIFGKYEVLIDKIANNKVEYIRKFSLNEGIYTNEKYKEYRDFIKKIVKKDNLKFTIKKQ